MDTKMDKPLLKLWIAIWFCLGGQALLFGFAVMHILTSPEPEPSPTVTNTHVNYPAVGVSCDDGKAYWTTMQSGGFPLTSALVVDDQFVDCGMTYKVNGEEISALDLLQHGMNN